MAEHKVRPRPAARPVEFIETRKQAMRALDYAASLKAAAVDSEFDPDDTLGCWSFSSGEGDRYVVMGEFATSVFAEWLCDVRTKKVYSYYKTDARIFKKLGLDLDPSFGADIVSLSWFRDEHLFEHGLKPQMWTWRRKKRKGYAEIFSYVRSGYVKPTILTPTQILGGEIPDDALLLHSKEDWRKILIEYSGDDAFDTGDLFWLHRDELQRVGYWPTYLRIDRPYTLALMACEDRGILIDQPGMRDIQRQAFADGMRHEHVFRAETGAPETLNFNAPAQKVAFLIDQLGWPAYDDLRSEKTDEPSTGKDAVARWIGEGIVAARFLRDRQRSFKLVSDVDGLCEGVSEDGRLRSNFKQHAADTGRISSTKFDEKRLRAQISMRGLVKVVERRVEIGCNQQNIVGKGEKDVYGLRGMFVAPLAGQRRANGSVAEEDCVLIVLDFSGFELCMMLHWVSKIHPNSKMLAAMLEHGSPSACHALTAILVFALDVKMDVWRDIKKKFPDQYKLSKNCVRASELVQTAQGFRRIGEICAGVPTGRSPLEFDLVTRDAIRPSESVFTAAQKSVVRVTTELGFSTVCTPDHEWPVVRGGVEVRVLTSDLRMGDLLLVQVGRNVHGENAAVSGVSIEPRTSFRPVDLPVVLTAEVARFLGYFVAEGRTAQSNVSYLTMVEMRATVADADVLRDVEQCFRAVVGDRLHVDDLVNGKGCSTRRFWVSSKHVHEWLINLGVGAESGSKQIPECVRTAPWALKREFLRAYYEGDGTISGYAVACTSKSEDLVRQVHAELVNVGVVGTVQQDWHEGYGWYWTVKVSSGRYVRKFKHRVGFVGKRKRRALRRVRVPAWEVSTLSVDGFDLSAAFHASTGRTRAKLAECLRGVRFGETRLRLCHRDAVTWEAMPLLVKQYAAAGMWTVRVTSIEDAGIIDVYDVFEPVQTEMILGGLVSVDCNFNLIYKGSPRMLASLREQDPNDDEVMRENTALFDGFHKIYPEVGEYQEWSIEYGYEHGWVPSVGGRRCHVPGLQSLDDGERGHWERKCTNFPCQASAANIVKAAMVLVEQDAELRALECFQLLQVHDEIVAECPRSKAERAMERMIELMKMPYKDELRVKLEVEGKFARSWLEAK